ncbi:hypothetical protein FHG64_06910 [Antarcticibacterium flavum]|uniref:Uncharacterized protein n=1 Tax=Antarcticibacterium flavum TaxID=2058175 RepID=A0A5B7X3E2_9FLAO|nr:MULTISPECIES: hypothetical protein [Antarcticibacterium]MCM4160405.1 hypothetical protein [Antarcticibacterium sp. W02-3]QCY69153.1 hypothetical protein FHG64_06910 [Antarcticibacterium flavum]
MLVNISYNQPKIRDKINTEVGKTFTLLERFRLNGTGSPKLHITSSSIDIHNLLVLDNNANICNIEMRPNGIIVMFRSLLETYALVIPYYKLKIYKGRAEEYSIYRDHYFIKVKAGSPAVHKYMMKIIDYKTGIAPTQIEDMQ